MGDPSWLEYAESQIGTAEVAGEKDNLKIIEYLKSVPSRPKNLTLHDEIAWCAAFGNHCLLHTGHDGTDSWAARSFLHYGRHISKPEVGCIVVLRRGTGWQGHVGFFTGKMDAERIELISGNVGNRVTRSYFNKKDVLGYRMPI